MMKLTPKQWFAFSFPSPFFAPAILCAVMHATSKPINKYDREHLKMCSKYVVTAFVNGLRALFCIIQNNHTTEWASLQPIIIIIFMFMLLNRALMWREWLRWKRTSSACYPLFFRTHTLCRKISRIFACKVKNAYILNSFFFLFCYNRRFPSPSGIHFNLFFFM